jgi:sugar phosphate permease
VCDASPDEKAPTELDPATQPGESSVIWTVWWTYGAFYFCRTNISAAVAEGGMGLDSDEIGWILAASKIAYGGGQLLNGQFSERISPRRLLVLGMFGSAALNVLFGFGAGLYFMIFVWACNGYCQSLGWTPCVRVLANWFPAIRRGKVIGIVGTGYQVTAVLTFIIASAAADQYGWRGAFFVPAVIMAASGVIMLLFLKESPADHADAPHATTAPTNKDRGDLVENLRLTVLNRQLWYLGLSLGLLNACRYGFLDWGLKHLKEVQETGVGKAGLKFAVLPFGAVFGSYLSGWATDRFFGGRRAPVICVLLVMLGVLSLMYDAVAHTSVPGTIVLLLAIGFCIYGPQVLLVGTAPSDLAKRGTSAAAAGFVNFMGYMGAASGDVVTGYFIKEKHGGWQVAIYIWAAWAFAAAFMAALLWNATAREEYIPDEE